MRISNLVYVFLSAFPFPSENSNSKISSSYERFHIVYFPVSLGILSRYFLFPYCPNEQTPVLYKQNKRKKKMLASTISFKYSPLEITIAYQG